MKHQPFKSWIFEDSESNHVYKSDLLNHLKNCSECMKLHKDWNQFYKEFVTIQEVPPAIGFSERWKESLPERRKIQQKKKAVTLLKFLLIAALIALTITMLLLQKSISFVDVLTNIYSIIMGLSISWSFLKGIVVVLLTLMPPAISVIGWVFLSTGFLLLVVSWLATIWRISTQGVYIK